MKKIYTLLAAATVATSAFALPVKSLEGAKLANPERYTQEYMNSAIENMKATTPEGMFRVVDGKGTEWSCLLCIAGELTLRYQDGTLTTLQDWPFYQMIVSAQPMVSGDNTWCQLNIQWPCYGYFNDDCFDEEGNLDKAKTEAIYGDKAFKAMSYEDFIAEWGMTTLFCVDNFYGIPAIQGRISSTTYRDSAGNDHALTPATIENQNFQYGNAAQWDWTGFNATTSEAEMTFNIKYDGGVFNSELSGDVAALGFSPVNWDTIGEVHIFNGGRNTADDEFGWAFSEAFNPLNFYYLAMCDETMSYYAKNSAGENICAFSDDVLPTQPYAFQETDNYAFFQGAIWAPENSELPYGLWSMKESKYTLNAAGTAISTYDLPPIEYNLIEALNCEAGQKQGFKGCYQGYTMVSVPGETYLGIGDKTNGLNLSTGCTLTNGYPIAGKYTGKIFFHNTPFEWTEYEALDAVGNGDYNALDPVSVKEVLSNSPVVSETYYNIQGQRLTSAPANGLYIVRALKADGTTTATKVAK